MGRADSEEIFEELYRRYHRAVITLFIRYGFSPDDAHELAQDTFVRVFQGMDTYRGAGEWSYISTTGRRVALNELRRRNAKRREASEVSLDNFPKALLLRDPDARPAEEALIDRDTLTQQQKRLKSAIEELPTAARQCLHLWLAGYGYREIQKILGITMDAVKSRLHEARLRLRERTSDDVDWPE